MKILFVSGFLGAGKTRFIMRMSKVTGRKFVIVENEFADINIDAERLRESGTNGDGASPFRKIVELSEGCICCSLNIDFNHSLYTIANSLDPDYLVVEPSGVAKTASIIEHVRMICYERIGILAPVTIIDGKNYEISRRNNPDIFYSQLQTAGTIVVSKSETWTEDDYRRLSEELHIPSDAEFLHKHYDKWSKDEFEELLRREYADLKNDILPNKLKKRFVLTAKNKGPDLETISFKRCTLRNPMELQSFLQILTSGVLGRVVRAKGFFPTANGENLNFDLVEGLYAITGMPLGKETSIVVIGSNLNRETIAYLVQN